MAEVRLTLGSVQAGALVSTALSGAVAFQTFLYFRHYRASDSLSLQALVLLVWAMDAAQSCLVSAVTWDYLIVNFSNKDIIDFIPPTLPATVTFTALLTFVVNGFFTQRVHKLSKGNWWFTAPTAFCLISRLGLAIVSTVAMYHLKSFKRFNELFGPVFTAGLSLSAFTDVLVTLGLCYYLRVLTRDALRSSAAKVLRITVIFADNNGVLTCVVAIASLICWVTMPDNLVFLGFHFSIGKLYSNSFLATLNMRDYLRRAVSAPVDVALVRANARPRATDLELRASRDDAWTPPGRNQFVGQNMEIKVDTAIQYD